MHHLPRYACVLVAYLFLVLIPAGASGETLSGKVFGGGSPLPNTTVEALTDGTTTVVAQSTTDAAGSYSLSLASGTYDLRVTPPAGSGFSQETVQNLVLAGADRTYDVILLTAGGTLTGTVRGYGGQPVPNVDVTLLTPNWQTIASTTTDANGQYSVPVGSGTVTLYVQAKWPPSPNALVPAYFWGYRFNVTVSGNTTMDVDLPVVKMSGTVKDAGGSVLAGATVQLETSSWAPNASADSNNTSTTTDADGYYEILGFAAGEHGGSASLTVRPPAGSNASILSEAGIVLTGDVTRDIVLAAPAALTGTVRGYGGQPVPNVDVTLLTPNWQTIASTTTDANGQYSVPVGSGTVTLYVQAKWPPSPNALVPAYFWGYRFNVTISGDTTVDVTLPVVKVSGTVTDSNGAPVPGVSLQLESSSWAPNASTDSNNTSTTTNANGYYEILGFAAGEHGGSASLTVRPPDASGFSIVSLANLTLTGDLTQRIILQRPDLSPPQIVAGPVVVHLSDTSVSISWTTNEAATSRVEYGIGSLTAVVNDNTLTTNHTVTLLDLTELSTYSFRVGSTDASGNGPTYSSVGTFATQGSPGDITPPVITGGPTVVFVDQTSAIIQWTTDEPASSTVDYGLTSTLGASVSSVAGKFRQTHSMPLAGLSAETAYFAQVTSADPDGNSTASSVFTFRTLAVPDTAAPVITAGPTVASVTDTKLTVEWTTDEPATSGVSYNDGTEFFVVSDSALTKEHSITLSGLTPQTVYFITVSSTDAVGNGPTLGGPVDGTTTATPDTAAPVISNLRVEDVTETSAVVKWTTDEPASSAVNYGLVSQSPDNTKADVASVIEHRMTLTGLQDGTRYYLTVSSTDGSGNTVVSDEIDFMTVSSFIDMPPTAPGPITAPVGPTNAVSLSLSWGASTDDVGLIEYEVLRDGEVIASVGAATTSYTDSTAPEGAVTYTVRATDTAGQTATSEPVTVVVDRTAPVISVVAPSETVLWSPNHKMVPLTLSITATDAGTPAPACRIVEITSNEPAEGAGDGTTASDWTFDGLDFAVRAERSGTGSGRVYTVTATCTDAAGNASTGTATVTVPKSQSKR